MAPPLKRGTAEFADCENCPFSKCGQPNNPVFSEYPEDPAWILIGDGVGHNEVRYKKPFIGPTGEVLNKLLFQIGRPREEIFIGNTVLCLGPSHADQKMKLDASRACSTRLKMELAQFPGKPVLTVGATAAKSVIPQEVLDAIDPPDTLPSHKKKAKDKQKAAFEAGQAREKALIRLTKSARKKLGREATPVAVAQLVDQLYEEELIKKAAKRKAVKKELKISDIAGTFFEVDIDGTGPRYLVPTIQPAALLKGGGRSIQGTHTPDLAFWNIQYDMGKIDGFARGKDLRLKLVTKTEWQDKRRADDLIREFFVEAQRTKFVALDLETYVDNPERHNALMAYMAKIKAIGLSTREQAISVLWELLSPWAKELIRTMLRDPTITKAFHNGLYDRTVCTANHMPIHGPWHDSLLAHHAAFPGMAHNLQSVTTQFYAVKPWKSEFRNSEETPEGLTQYNALDTFTTAKLIAPLEILVKRNKVERIYELDRKMAEVASQMHLDGCPVSKEVNDQLLTTLMGRVRETREKVEHIANDPEVQKLVWYRLAAEQAKKQRKNDPISGVERHKIRLEELNKKVAKNKWQWKASSSLHIAALLKALGVELNTVTDSGMTSTKKDILESLVHIPIVRDIIDFREADKLVSTFVWPIFDRRLSNGEMSYGFADPDDRVHPIWSIHKITGRWASRDPVESNVPKAKFKKLPDGTKKIIRPNIRAQIVAPKGRKFVGFDFAQLEARIIALVSGDPWLCKVFADGKDIHRECAKLVWAIFDSLPEDEQKKLRDMVKPFEYGAFYGGSPQTLWTNLVKEGQDIKLSDVISTVNKLMGGMKGVVQWQQTSIALASQPPFQVTSFLYKRRRCFPLGQADRNEAINFPAQSSAADIMNFGVERCMAGIDRFVGAFPILQIHDSCIFECWEEDAEALAAYVKECFTQEYEINGITIPFPIDIKIGNSWADV